MRLNDATRRDATLRGVTTAPRPLRAVPAPGHFTPSARTSQDHASCRYRGKQGYRSNFPTVDPTLERVNSLLSPLWNFVQIRGIIGTGPGAVEQEAFVRVNLLCWNDESRNCNIFSVLSIFKYNPGKASNKFITSQ